MGKTVIENRARRQKLLTIEQHDSKMATLLTAGSAVVEPEPAPGHVIFSSIACPACGFKLMDIAGTTTADPDGGKFRECGCMQCGRRVWRKTP